MNEEIKEDVSDLMELLETTSKKEFYRLTIDHELVVRLYNYITNLQQENQKYKEVIDKIDKYINDYNVFEVFSFPLMKRWEEEQVKSSIDYEFKTSLIKNLKDILKGVNND